MIRIVSLVLIAILFAACETTETRVSKTILLDGSYGSIIYDGVITRSEVGSKILVTIDKISLEYVKDARFNKTENAELVVVQLVATKRVEGEENAPRKVLHREFQQISVTLNANTPTGKIGGLKFEFPRSLTARADHIGIALIDSKRMMWPIRGELK